MVKEKEKDQNGALGPTPKSWRARSYKIESDNTFWHSTWNKNCL